MLKVAAVLTFATGPLTLSLLSRGMGSSLLPLIVACLSGPIAYGALLWAASLVLISLAHIEEELAHHSAADTAPRFLVVGEAHQMITRKAFSARQRQRSRLRSWSLALRIVAVVWWLAGIVFIVSMGWDMLPPRTWKALLTMFIEPLISFAAYGAVIWSLSLLMLSFDQIEKNTFLSALRRGEDENP